MLENDYAFDEKTLICILLSEGMSVESVEKVLTHLPNKMFLDRDSRTIYGLIQDLFSTDDRELIGTTHFKHKIEKMAIMEMIDSDTYFYELDSYWIPSATMWSWVKKIQTRHFKERFKLASSQEEFEEIIKEKQQYAFQDRMVSISEEADKAIEMYDKAFKSAIFTSYPSIDNEIGSLQGGDMIVLAGATGGCKTAFMLNVAKAIAKQGKTVDIFSLEMPRWQLQQRIICSEACIDANKFRSFSLSDEDKKRYQDYANNQFKDMKINIFQKQYASIDEIKNIVKNSDSDIVFIDYLGLIGGNSFKSSYERYSEISREIKLLAMQSNKPIVALHQLSRSFQDREDKTPKTSDLRDSGKIEQDADMIWFVYRPWQFDQKKYLKEDLRFILAKNRHGANCKEVSLVFNGMYQQVLEPIKNMKWVGEK